MSYKLWFFPFVFLMEINLSAQTSDQFVKYNEIQVKSLAGPYQNYQLMISLPRSYSLTSAGRYPVIYVLDTEWNFGFMEESYRKLNQLGMLPEMILVGVGYGSSVPGNGNYRDRDMGPTSSGINYAEAFLSFFEKTLIPYMDTTFRTSRERLIHGHSMGGLFSSYVLFTKPELFTHYIISSPSWWWKNKKFIFQLEADYAAKHNRLPARVFISVGEKDGAGMVKPWKKFVALQKTRHYEDFFLVSQSYPGKDHLTVMDVAAFDGLKTLFQTK